jgi:4-amino-4-deoxychorismate lyase
MSLLFETIRIENGILMYPEYHEKRMLRSRMALFGENETIFLRQVISIPGEFSSGIVRCRVDYGKTIDALKFTHYKRKPLRKFQVVVNDEIEYPFKFSDRSALESLLKGKNTADEIILVQHGLITDTSFSNLIFYDGRKWITSTSPLLNGTCRERLIRERKIMERQISLKELYSFQGFKIINAMIYPEDMEMISVDACTQP